MTSTQLGTSDFNALSTERPDGMHPEVDITSEDKMQELEREFAYLHATGVIEAHCLTEEVDGAMVFYNTRTASIDITDEVLYLHSRRLLDVHSMHSHWISLRDESEPIAEKAGA